MLGQGTKGIAYFAALRSYDGEHCLNCGKVVEHPPDPEHTRLHLSDCTCNDECKNKAIPKFVHKWKVFRKSILERDEYKCQKCGSKKVNFLTVHHIKPIGDNGNCYDPNNVITLCNRCHKIIHVNIDRKGR